MISSSLTRRATILIAAICFATACDDSDPVNPDPHPNVGRMNLDVEGGMQITFNQAKTASGTLTLSDGDVVTLTFLAPDGTEEPNANNTERFDLRVNFPNGNPAGLVFTPSAADEYSGTFTRTSPTGANPMIVQFELWHSSASEPHSDGKWNVNVIVQ